MMFALSMEARVIPYMKLKLQEFSEFLWFTKMPTFWGRYLWIAPNSSRHSYSHGCIPLLVLIHSCKSGFSVAAVEKHLNVGA